MSWAYSAGEMVSTAADLNRFYRALLGGRLLSRPLLAQMETTVPEDPSAPEAGGYGLGLYWVQLPCSRFWGHDGGTIGHRTISWHSADGRTQLTYAQNMAFYAVPAIDAALADFIVTALCGDQSATRTAVATPDLRPLLVSR